MPITFHTRCLTFYSQVEHFHTILCLLLFFLVLQGWKERERTHGELPGYTKRREGGEKKNADQVKDTGSRGGKKQRGTQFT